jgi:hypothetical protein
VDHVPPRACFPDGFMPEELEFPACKECNEGATKQDQIFGFYTMFLDFDESKMTRPEDRAKLEKLRQGILNNYPDALPDTLSARPVYHDGLIQTLFPQALDSDLTSTERSCRDRRTEACTCVVYGRDREDRDVRASVFRERLPTPTQRYGGPDAAFHLSPAGNGGRDTPQYQGLRRPLPVYVGGGARRMRTSSISQPSLDRGSSSGALLCANRSQYRAVALCPKLPGSLGPAGRDLELLLPSQASSEGSRSFWAGFARHYSALVTAAIAPRAAAAALQSAAILFNLDA